MLTCSNLTQPPHPVRRRAGPVRRGVPGDDGVRAQEGVAGDHAAHRARRGALVARAGDEQAACQGEVLFALAPPVFEVPRC